METEQTWNPNIPDQEVRLRNNPGRRGLTTGTTKESGGRLLVLINFGPNEKTYKRYEQLELCNQPEGIKDLIEAGRFGTPDDLRRILTFEKVKGHLTNVFYSMESSNTDFYAYQFKPVLKFLDSPVGRLLIADEVGLGKTVESVYIWKELQAREDARRLLIVCPAMLRDKWKNDLLSRFNISAEVADTRKLLEKVHLCLNNRNSQALSFIQILSLESLRPPKNWEDLDEEDVKDPKAELAWLLNQNKATDEFGIFDLVIIDEAHYLRNPETASHKLGNILREAARHLLLLTATPIQIHSDNLFQLLKLISPEDFFDPSVFEKMLNANKPVIEAQKLIWRNPPDLDGTKEAIEQAIQSDYFSNNLRLQQAYAELKDVEILELETQVRLRQVLESSSLFGQFMTRSRKRDVMEDRVKRSPQPLTVDFSPLEKQVYDYVTHQIRQQARGQQGVALFRLIARQRQMASCMVAALQAWKNKGVLDELLQEENNLLWEDLGIWEDDEFELPEWPFIEVDVDFDELKKIDTKYNELIIFLRAELEKNSIEKFVLFAYFRGTLDYLQERLEADGIQTCLIRGGMGQEKQAVLQKFRDGQPSVLLSSEVGSEGIDLQFCRFIINYDLPWNPMRVEQRIGRLDRIGQKSDRISIVHFSIKNTIEEYILSRLYERINIFEESIGDLEEILGEETEQLISEFFNSSLTEEEIKQRTDDTIIAIANKKAEQEDLESEAINMMAFSDYILSTINKSREQGRWLKPEELKAFVEDFFKLQYPGTVIVPKSNQVFEISLSEQAKVNLRLFCEQRRFSTPTRLYHPGQQPIPCFFESKMAGTMGKENHELLDPTHPFIQWIQHKYEPESKNETGSQTFHRVSASQLSSEELGIPQGIYVYVIHRWQFEGLRKENRLVYKVIRLEDSQELPDDTAETLISTISLRADQRPNVVNLVDVNLVLNAYEQSEDCLQEAFFEAEEAFRIENTDWCNVQERSAIAYAERKRQELEERIANFRAENKLRTIPLEEGRLRKVEQDLRTTLSKIAQKREEISSSNPALAAGVIFVKD
ncbi:DEAD/DEAH box helicase family protein [Microcoleus sp. FACHB-53]|nr:DEAD/DEAH box helicase family protein [Microcoleus sp. FACHB-53]